LSLLPAAEKELLQTLSVIGKEPALELIRRVTGEQVEQLDPLLTNLQLGGLSTISRVSPARSTPSNTRSRKRSSYNSLLANRRLTTHEQIGNAIKTLFEDQLEDHYGELAHHYLCSSNAAKLCTTHYWPENTLLVGPPIPKLAV